MFLNPQWQRLKGEGSEDEADLKRPGTQFMGIDREQGRNQPHACCRDKNGKKKSNEYFFVQHFLIAGGLECWV